MIRRILGAATAAAVLTSAASPAHAVHMYWTYDRFTTAEDCMSRARYAAGVYGVENITAGETHVQGALEPDIFITFFCLPSPAGATGLLVVAADQSANLEDGEVQDVRNELWSLFIR